jgi:phage tail-like protein
MPDPGQQNRFKVVIDDLDIGNFSKCEGLKASYDMKSYEEGGQNAFVHMLPGRVKYEHITLTRAVDHESKKLAVWFASFRVAVRRANAQITVMNSAGHDVMDWTFSGVVPVSWSAGASDIGGTGALTETLVLSHEGFFDAAMAVPGGALPSLHVDVPLV